MAVERLVAHLVARALKILVLGKWWTKMAIVKRNKLQIEDRPNLIRRKIVFTLPAIGITACAQGSLSGNYTYGAYRCFTPSQAELRDFDIDSKSEEQQLFGYSRVYLPDFNYTHLEGQIERELCWAAAIQAVLSYHGEIVSQHRVVRKVRGVANEKGFSGASLLEIMKGFSGPFSNTHVTNGNSMALVNDIGAGNPVILGIKRSDQQQGHVVVAYGVIFLPDPSGHMIREVRYWDPWGNQGNIDINGCELEDILEFSLHASRPTF